MGEKSVEKKEVPHGHTPGPWCVVDFAGTPAILGPDGKAVTPLNDADAALIAAAPDLLEALVEARSMMPRGITNCAGYKCRQRNCEACYGDQAEPYDTTRIDAAIAKALNPSTTHPVRDGGEG